MEEIQRIIFWKLYSTKLKNLKEMDNFQDKYHLPKLNQDQISKSNRPVASKEIEAVIKSLPNKQINKQTKKPRTTWFQLRILQDFQRRTNTNTLQIVPHNRNRRNIAKLFMSLQLPWYSNQRKTLLRKRITDQSHLWTLMQKY